MYVIACAQSLFQMSTFHSDAYMRHPAWRAQIYMYAASIRCVFHINSQLVAGI